VHQACPPLAHTPNSALRDWHHRARPSAESRRPRRISDRDKHNVLVPTSSSHRPFAWAGGRGPSPRNVPCRAMLMGWRPRVLWLPALVGARNMGRHGGGSKMAERSSATATAPVVIIVQGNHTTDNYFRGLAPWGAIVATGWPILQVVLRSRKPPLPPPNAAPLPRSRTRLTTDAQRCPPPRPCERLVHRPMPTATGGPTIRCWRRTRPSLRPSTNALSLKRTRRTHWGMRTGLHLAPSTRRRPPVSQARRRVSTRHARCRVKRMTLDVCRNIRHSVS
jgi:hypothetical protein